MFIKLNPLAEPKVVIVAPDSICYKGNEAYLATKLLLPSKISPKDIIFYSVPKGKLTKTVATPLLEELAEYLKTQGIEYLAVVSADLFKFITKSKNFSLQVGSLVEGAKDKKFNFEGVKVIPVLSPIVLNKFPNKIDQVNQGLSVIKQCSIGNTENLNTGKDVRKFKKEVVAVTKKEVLESLKALLKEPRLFVDIETTGLEWYNKELLTMSFTGDGEVAYCIAIHKKYHDKDTYNYIKKALKKFLIKYQNELGKELIGHNWVGFDQAFITHEIMRDKDFSASVVPYINNYNPQDTLFMAYILYNSTERQSLSLKKLAYKYLGDWDAKIDQKNLYNTPLAEVAHYNNLDVLATKLIYDELFPEIEKQGFTKVLKDWHTYGKQLLKLKMVGLRVDLEKTKNLKEELGTKIIEHKAKLNNIEKVKEAAVYLAKEKAKKRNKILKTKQTTWQEEYEDFNPNSNAHKQYLFFEVLKLEPISFSRLTDKPSTDKDSLKSWLEDAKVAKEAKTIIEHIMEITLAQKIHSTYLKNMIEGVVEVAPNDFRIFANFNQTATITGRLSSSGVINMQTIPSSSAYGKEVKKLFIAPDGYFLASIDYSALN